MSGERSGERFRDVLRGTIDGKTVVARRGATVLETAESVGIRIPTLCHREGLPPDGNCRLCVVETKGKLVISCMFPVREDGFAILTQSPGVREARRFVLSLMLNRAPKAPAILKLAGEYGAGADPRFSRDPDNCVRCGRCVRACRANRTEAIALVGRGFERSVSGPFEKPPPDCVGCLSCAFVCPTGNILYSERDGKRRIWDKEFRLVPCPECGTPVFTEEQIRFLGEKASGLCPECGRRRLASALRNAEPLSGGSRGF
ncbi:MAG: (2Fe-2S)-binding protein [Deltaproteobacteria bacterium]|jgi:NADH dehydrogenase/NADH:ubiquinone oxidoreductase subunit G|nr:(2Fe-2S)-binding protein [Deltaproteobacteria bacterium]